MHNRVGESKFELIGQNDDTYLTHTACDKTKQYLAGKTWENNICLSDATSCGVEH